LLPSREKEKIGKSARETKKNGISGSNVPSERIEEINDMREDLP